MSLSRLTAAPVKAEARVVRRAYKFRAYPTSGQESRAVMCLRDHQLLYNAALEERRESWARARVCIGYCSQSAQLKDIRAFDPDQIRWSFSSQQATLRRLNKAMQAFYRRCRTGVGQKGYPRFKSLDRWNSVVWPEDGDGCRWKPDLGRVYLQGIGHVKVRAHRAVAGSVKTITLKREGRCWYVVLACTEEMPEPLAPTGREIGLDVGVARFATTSDGEVISNPKFARAAVQEITAAQQAFGRKKRGSSNRRRAKAKLIAAHRRIRNRRIDFHHKTARALVNSCDAIALEDLDITNMTKSAKGSEDKPGRHVAQKSGLNRVIYDAGWGQFAGILVVKAEEAARRVVFVDPRHTSINCHQCGARCTRQRQDTVICPVHGAIDADVNGARNIYIRAGLGSDQAASAV